MRVMIDTNVVLDVLLKRDMFFKFSYDILKLSAIGEIEGYISASAVTNIYYILHRNNKNKTASLKAIRDLLLLVKVVDVGNADITAALDMGFGDYEDDVQSAVAKRHRINWIITRNEDDFKHSSIPAVSPKDFLEQFNHSKE